MYSKTLFKHTILLAFISAGLISCSSDDANNFAIEDDLEIGKTIAPDVGGPNEPNQVYMNFGEGSSAVVKRDAWGLGFYSGKQFRVKLNSSLKMFAAPLGKQDIDAITSEDTIGVSGKLATLTEGSDQFVDAPNGDLNETAIDEIKEQDEDDPVYLLQLGNQLGTQTPETGSVAVDASPDPDQNDGIRGYKKIRILRQDDGYLLQYADLDDKQHEEIFIPKKDDQSFLYFSIEKGDVMDFELQNWDLLFTTYTGLLDMTGSGFGEGYAAYGFSDYVVSNAVNGVQVAQVITPNTRRVIVLELLVNQIKPRMRLNQLLVEVTKIFPEMI